MAATAGYLGAFYVSTGVSTSLTDEAMSTSDNQTFRITAAAHSYLDPAVAVTVQNKTNEVQTVTITGAPSGGNFTLTFNGNTTANIAFNAAASAVQSALVALSGVGSGQVAVTGSNGGPYTVEFTGTLALANQPQMTASGAGLTGGTTPGVTVATIWDGHDWTTITTGFTLYYPGGFVIFNAPLGSSGSACRIHAGNYLTISLAGNAKSAEYQVNNNLIDITTMQGPSGTPWKTMLPTLNDASIKMNQWWTDNFYLNNLSNLLVLVMYSGANSNQRFQAYGYLKTDSMKIDVANANDESLDFTVSGPVTYVAS